MNKQERVNLIIEYETGEITEDNYLELFSDLIKSGMCWTLQGCYGRTAQNMINNKIINKFGKIIRRVEK